jgi:hypothetical protein
VRLYLSSFRLGDHPERLVPLRDGQALIVNGATHTLI